MNKFQHYYKAIDFLEGLFNLPLQKDYMSDNKHADIYLKRMRYFLNLLGNPDKGLKFIHIAGTSGKGTVTAMVHNIIHASGQKIGSFTSPFVTTSIEKIKVGNKYIAPRELADITEYLKPFINQAYISGPYGAPSYFEIFLAIALIYFKRSHCKWVVLEVGLGGRYDATNVINNPIVTAITNIDFDHTELLGKTLKKIAFDKAGIIKSRSIFVTTEQKPSLTKMFKTICISKKALFYQLPHQNSYQEYNKDLATVIAKKIGVDSRFINQGIKKTALPCRFEIIKENPFIVLDGAHNRSKIQSTINNIRNLNFNKLHLIIGIVNNKDHVTILEQIIPFANNIFYTRFQIKDRQCAHPLELLKKSKKYFKKTAKAYIYLDPGEALSSAKKKAGRKDLILVVGSFFLAGGLRKNWYSEEWVLQHRKSF